MSCRISPACSTPFTRLWTPPSTTRPAAARHCGSSSPWLPIRASGGGAAPRLRQVNLALTQWGGGGGEERAFRGPPLSCLLSAHLGMCLLSCRKASASGLSGLCSSQSLRSSISPTQWGSFLMMGGVTELREPPTPPPTHHRPHYPPAPQCLQIL